MDFVAATSNDHWFKQHPEKIAGVEFETTSFFFPIQVRGTMDDVRRVMAVENNGGKKKPKNIALAKAKAKALKLKLQLK